MIGDKEFDEKEEKEQGVSLLRMISVVRRSTVRSKCSSRCDAKRFRRDKENCVILWRIELNIRLG